MPASANVRRSVARIARHPAGAVALALAAFASPAALAAADDLSAPAAPDGGFPGVMEFGRRIVDGVVDTGSAVVGAIRSNAAATRPSATWRSAPAASFTGRAVDYAARANATAAAIGDPARQAAAARAPDPAAARAADSPLETAFGARWRVLQGDADSHVPVVAWMADVEPVAIGGLNRPTALRPSLHLSAEWALGGDLTLGVMPGMAFDLDPTGRRQANGTLALTLGKAWTPQWRTFVDLSRDRMMATLLPGTGLGTGGPSTALDAGITFTAGPGTQLDLALTRGLSAAAPAFQAGVGMSSSF